MDFTTRKPVIKIQLPGPWSCIPQAFLRPVGNRIATGAEKFLNFSTLANTKMGANGCRAAVVTRRNCRRLKDCNQRKNCGYSIVVRCFSPSHDWSNFKSYGI